MIELPQGVSARLQSGVLTLSGKNGASSKIFDARNVTIKIDGNKITLESGSKTHLNSANAHIQNLVKGVNEGFTQKMRVIYSHFPIALETKGDMLIIKNFLGEKKPRISRILGKTKIAVAGKEVTVTGPSKEDMGQTIANIRTATKIKNRDSRIFQDGIYPIDE